MKSGNESRLCLFLFEGIERGIASTSALCVFMAPVLLLIQVYFFQRVVIIRSYVAFDFCMMSDLVGTKTVKDVTSHSPAKVNPFVFNQTPYTQGMRRAGLSGYLLGSRLNIGWETGQVLSRGQFMLQVTTGVLYHPLFARAFEEEMSSDWQKMNPPRI